MFLKLPFLVRIHRGRREIRSSRPLQWRLAFLLNSLRRRRRSHSLLLGLLRLPTRYHLHTRLWSWSDWWCLPWNSIRAHHQRKNHLLLLHQMLTLRKGSRPTMIGRSKSNGCISSYYSTSLLLVFVCAFFQVNVAKNREKWGCTFCMTRTVGVGPTVIREKPIGWIGIVSIQQRRWESVLSKKNLWLTCSVGHKMTHPSPQAPYSVF